MTSVIFYEDNEAFSNGEGSLPNNDFIVRLISAQIRTHPAQTRGKLKGGWFKFA